jgi:hypothetical protein
MVLKNTFYRMMYALALILALYGYFFVKHSATSALFAHNYFASGIFSQGIFSAGNFSIGLFSVGLFSVGIFSIGVFSVGIFSLGLFSIGLWTSGFVLWGRFKKHVRVNTYTRNYSGGYNHSRRSSHSSHSSHSNARRRPSGNS